MSVPSDQDKKLDFKPITQGLGFHPFSDGLPYAPVNPQAQNNRARPTTAPQVLAGPTAGAGAVAAGRPRVAPSVLSRTPVTVAPPQAPVSARTQIPAAMVSPIAPPLAPAFEKPRPGWAFLFKKALAYALDVSFAVGLCLFAVAWAVLKQQWNPAQLKTLPVLIAGGALSLCACWLLITAQEVAFGTTLGKRLFGLRLAGTAGAILGRALLFIPSVGILGLGILWALFDSHRRSWHDLAAGVDVVEIAQL